MKGLRRPAASLGNILDLDALARNPAWVQPGNPDGSPLYTAIQSRAMPPEGTADTPAPELTAFDLSAVRDWIEQLPPLTRCADRTRLHSADIANLVAKSLAAMDPARALTTRYISLAPLHNACATRAEIDAARQAVTVLVNALSLGLEPVRLTATDPEQLLLEIDLGLLGWDAERWDRLAFRAPAFPFVVFDPAVRGATGTPTPLVNADWFADAATRAPLYYELLGLPEQLPALFASLRIDPADQKRGALDRMGLRTSVVARGNRLIERRPFANGAAWISREFAPTAGRPDLFDLTLSAAAPANGPSRPQPQPDASVLHFDLPNGFPAYFIANASGARLNDLPQSILKDDAHPTARFAAAQSCIGCHGSSGAVLSRDRTDDLKARLATDTTLAKDVRERLLAPHPEPAEWTRKINEDEARVQRALAAAGIDRALRIDGLEAVPALIARYRRGVTLDELAALTDLTPQALNDFGKSGSATLADVTRRLQFGPVPRPEVDAVLPEIASRKGLPGGAAGSTFTALPSAARSDGVSPPQLVLTAERASYQPGDLLLLTARANFNCNLTVVTVDRLGRATVLYPNEFDTNNAIDAGREIRIPGEKAPFQLRLRDPGLETLIGICSATAKTVDGIHHDFEKQRFTQLGDYRAFLQRNWGVRDNGESKPARPRAARKPNDPAPPPAEPAKAEIQARTAIRIKIE